MELLSIPTFCSATGLGRTSVYKLLKEGTLTAVKVGRRTLIRRADMEAWKAGLVEYQPSVGAALGDAYEA